VGRWDQNGSWGDWLGGCGLNSTGSGQGPVAGCCERGDEPSDSCTTELVIPACANKLAALTIHITDLFKITN
jgi:hypothetical protein